jgi:hypothetical protein
MRETDDWRAPYVGRAPRRYQTATQAEAAKRAFEARSREFDEEQDFARQAAQELRERKQRESDDELRRHVADIGADAVLKIARRGDPDFRLPPRVEEE